MSLIRNSVNGKSVIAEYYQEVKCKPDSFLQCWPSTAKISENHLNSCMELISVNGSREIMCNISNGLFVWFNVRQHDSGYIDGRIFYILKIYFLGSNCMAACTC